MNVAKGDKLKLKKPIGNLTNVGDTFTVYQVDGSIVHIRCQYGIGAISMNSIEEYFDAVKEEKTMVDTNCKFVAGQLITLIEDVEALKPMKQWDFFEVEEIMPTGIVRLFCHEDGKQRYVAVAVANEFFDSAVNNPNIRYEDGTNTPTPLSDTIKVEGNQATAVSKAAIKDKNYNFYHGRVKIEVEVSKRFSKNEVSSAIISTANNALSPYVVTGCVDTGADGITPYAVNEEYIDALLNASDIQVETYANKCTVVVVTLPNGFVLTASSSSASDVTYSEDTGAKNCLAKIKSQLWELEAYFLHKITESSVQEYGITMGLVDCTSIECEDCPLEVQCDDACSENCDTCPDRAVCDWCD